MIKQVTTYTVKCDSCHITTADLGAPYDEDAGLAETESQIMGWIEDVDGKHLCPNCLEYEVEICRKKLLIN